MTIILQDPWFFLLILLFGLGSTVFGALVVFSDQFLALMYRTLWQETELTKRVFPREQSYFYDRYVTGAGSLIVGIACLALFASTFLK